MTKIQQKNFPLLSQFQMSQLKQSIYYLKIAELKEICDDLKLPIKGKKLELIDRILAYIKTGEVQPIPSIPEVSKAKKGQKCTLTSEALILHGNYKNDLITRQFMQSLIGEHFHFTAFGIDWINERWYERNPPTYQQFAKFWQEEYSKRKLQKPPPKEEWAYINFCQRYLQAKPNASRAELSQSWEKERNEHLQIVRRLLEY